MKSKKRMIGITMAADISAAAAGCDREAAVEESTRPSVSRAEEPSSEEQTQKPTSPQPSEIESFPDAERETKAEPLRDRKRIVMMTDIHYLAQSLTDQGDVFRSMVEHGDGKLTNYVWEITDAAFEEIQLLSPDVLIISGDLTLQEEKKSHEELAGKLEQVENAGITVVVIPGNHDINNPSTTVYSGSGRFPAEPTIPNDFVRTYDEYGYAEANSRDLSSLSYTYDLGPAMHLLMPDTCQCESRNRVGGMIKTEVYKWIDQRLEDARDSGVILLPVAHRNLLKESKVYVDDCTTEHSEGPIRKLESKNIPLFLSGHLHVQHYVQNSDIGIYETVTSFMGTPPCRYGILEYTEGEPFSYHTNQVNIEKQARKHRSTDENLLNFNACCPPTLSRIFYNQTYGAMKDSTEKETGSVYVKLTEPEKQQMPKVCADINATCYVDKAHEVAGRTVKGPGYKIWREYCYPSILYEYLEYTAEDAIKDYNSLTVKWNRSFSCGWVNILD